MKSTYEITRDHESRELEAPSDSYRYRVFSSLLSYTISYRKDLRGILLNGCRLSDYLVKRDSTCISDVSLVPHMTVSPLLLGTINKSVNRVFEASSFRYRIRFQSCADSAYHHFFLQFRNCFLEKGILS